MRKFPDIKDSADSLGEPAESFVNRQKNTFTNQRISLQKLETFHSKIETEEKFEAEISLSNELEALNQEELNNLGFDVSDQLLSKQSRRYSKMKDKLIVATQATNLSEILRSQGKSNTEILQTLISRFKNEPALQTWIQNWKQFLQLSKYAQSRNPEERKIIEQVISNSNFTSDKSFDRAFAQIIQDERISDTTRFELQKKFGTENVQTVKELDKCLSRISDHKNRVESKLKAKEQEKNHLEEDVEILSKQIEEKSPYDPERIELEKELNRKKKEIDGFQKEIVVLKESQPEKVSFVLRNNVEAIRGVDGNRFVRLLDKDFSIRLPENRLFMSRQNVRSINLIFPYAILDKLGVGNTVFTPGLISNSTPSKEHRNLGHIILSTLGYDDKRILSQPEINQLSKDLSVLKNEKSNSTGKEDLVELGIWKTQSQNVDRGRLKELLQLIKEKRGRMGDFQTLKKVARG